MEWRANYFSVRLNRLSFWIMPGAAVSLPPGNWAGTLLPLMGVRTIRGHYAYPTHPTSAFHLESPALWAAIN